MEQIRDLLKKIKTRDDIPNFLINAGLNNNICELGVFSGDGIENLIKCNPKLLIGIDIWEDNGLLTVTDGMSQTKMNENYIKSLKVMLKYPQVKYIKGNTTDYINLFDNDFFDFVYVDSDHSYEGVKKDLNSWWDKIKTNGVLAGHDYFEHTSSYTFGVVEAVNDFIKEKGISQENFYVTSESFSPSFFIIKSSNSNSLTTIANKNTTDKGTIYGEAHGYTEIYGKYIPQNNSCKVLEIGIWHGDSIRMWNEYNSNIELYAVDIDPKIYEYLNGSEKFKLYLGDQSDETFMCNILSESDNDIDFVIDDGSHNHDDILNSFKFLFPKMKKGSTYFIEDLHADHAEKDKLMVNLFLEISKNQIELSDCKFFCNGKLLMFRK
jgi:hypothetical protein